MSLKIRFYQGLEKRLAMLVIEAVIAALLEAEWVIFCVVSRNETNLAFS